jgi:hypothetical protein
MPCDLKGLEVQSRERHFFWEELMTLYQISPNRIFEEVGGPGW